MGAAGRKRRARTRMGAAGRKRRARTRMGAAGESVVHARGRRG
nr:MAG: hypothetical protein [Molluscum contagiosum virus]